MEKREVSATLKRTLSSMAVVDDNHHTENEESSIKEIISYERVAISANYLMERTKHRPKIAIICGSGLEFDLNPTAGLADLLENADVFPYSEIPNFPISTVPGHKSRMLFGLLNNIPVMLMQGRFHAYEGYALELCAMPVRVMKLCGITDLIVTNAAGGLNEKFRAGDIMVLKDHINMPGFTGMHPLRGKNDTRFGARFFALNDCYDTRYRKLAQKIYRNMGDQVPGKTGKLHEGVYTMLGGPNFETVAELRMLKICGVDAVGMSTIPEVLVARHCGINVFSFSLITNECIMEEDANEQPEHDEVIATAKQREEQLRSFVAQMIIGIDDINSKQSSANGEA